MYCRKCGKWINGDAELCADCQQNEELFKVENETPAQQAAQNTQYQYFFNPSAQQSTQQPYSQPMYSQPVQPQDKGSRMTGFGFALAGTIVGFFAFIFSYLLVIFSAVGASAILFPFALGTTIFTMISGVKSLNTSKACTRAGKVKPIPAFIMGIVNVVVAGLSFFFIFLALMVLLVVI